MYGCQQFMCYCLLRKILCLLKRARKGHQVQVCSAGFTRYLIDLVIRGIELSHDLAIYVLIFLDIKGEEHGGVSPCFDFK